MELAPCPCGKTPERLIVDGEHAAPKWASVSGFCCGEWSIEFRNQYKLTGSDESNALAAAAWNAAPRAKKE